MTATKKTSKKRGATEKQRKFNTPPRNKIGAKPRSAKACANLAKRVVKSAKPRARRTTREIAEELELNAQVGITRINPDHDQNIVQRFVEAYKRTGNPFLAKEELGLSQSVVNNIIRSNPDLRADMRALLFSCGVTEERIIEEQARIAFSDPRRFFAEDGSMLPVHEWPEDIARATSGMDIVTSRSKNGKILDVTVKPRLWDKGQSLRELAKMARIAGAEQLEHSGRGGGPVQIKTETKQDIIGTLMSLVTPKEDPK